MIKSFSKIGSFYGELEFKGDKSVSHRAVIFSAMAEGESRITNLSEGDDVRSTVNCLKQAGIIITADNDSLIIKGKGYKKLERPDTAFDAGNSGTTARLMTGLLAVQQFPSVITGDSSLSLRPMNRVIAPLSLMGADIRSEQGKLPLNIFPSSELKNIHYEMQVPSAQVKSAVIIAALHCSKETIIKETAETRNHTELMLNLRTEKSNNGRLIYVSDKDYPVPKEYYIPGDISSAVFFIVLTLLSEGSYLTIKNILLNSTRTAVIDILRQMGGSIEVTVKKTSSGEDYGDVLVRSSRLKNISIPKELIPNLIDEIPALTIAGIFAEGKFEVRNASELRVKESDRIRSIVDNLLLTDLEIEEFDDGFTVQGNPGDYMPVFDSFDDHRIAMAFTIFSMLLNSGGSVNGIECCRISNNNFLDQVKACYDSSKITRNREL